MNAERKSLSDRVTLLVFKDNYEARSFQVPLKWITRFGTLIGVVLGLTVLSSLLAIKYYRTAHKGNPARVQELEQEVGDLRSALAAKPAAAPPVAEATSTPAEPEQTPPASPVSSAVATSDPVFGVFPQSVQPRPAQDPASPISVVSPKAVWSGKALQVSFAIQYNSEDKGNQQGRIIVLARGPGLLLAYPESIFNPTGNQALIAPERGEYFSVSRYREVKAKFGPVNSTDDLKEVEIFLLSEGGQILIHEKLTPAPLASAAKPAASTAVKPSPGGP